MRKVVLMDLSEYWDLKAWSSLAWSEDLSKETAVASLKMIDNILGNAKHQEEGT